MSALRIAGIAEPFVRPRALAHLRKGRVVVFAGGTPTGTFGGAAVQVASSGQLGLNNTGDTLTLSDGATVIDTATYGSEGGMDQSIVRDGAMWVRHSTLPDTVGAYSPGTFSDGYLP